MKRMLVTIAAALGYLQTACAAENHTLPPNLAEAANISATSEYSRAYQARFVADGHVPLTRGHDDLSRAWCVNGNTHRAGAEIVFEWPGKVLVSEVIYYGRTAWFLEECWKGYELLVDGQAEAIASGTLRMEEGPQRIKLPRQTEVRKLRLKFTSSYGGPNPGASEIQIFSTSPSSSVLKAVFKRSGPPTDEPEEGAVAELVAELHATHRERYSPGEQHTERVKTGENLAELQREVLLWDVEKVVAIKRHEINSSHVYTYHNEGFRAGGGLFLAHLNGRKQAEKIQPLVESAQGQILDCDLSYDAKKVLFSWRQKEDAGYHVFTINLDGSQLQQLTDGEWHDYNACWLPDGGIAFVSTRNAQFAYCWNSPVGVVHRMEADGSNVRRLSANYLNDFTPYPLEDGRIIYSRWEYVDKPAIPIQSLWTINPDGTGLAGYYGNRVISPGTFMEARSIPGTGLILCTMTGHNDGARGAIGRIDTSRGANAQEAITNLTPDVPVPGVSEGDGNFGGSKLYSSPLPLDRHRFLVSARGPLLVRNMSGSCVSTVLARPDDGMQWFGGQPIRTKPRPGLLAERTGSGKNREKMAYLYVQDVYNGLESHVKRGEVKRLRVVREMPKTVRIDPDKRAFGFQFPVISAGATYAGKEVLGEVEVAEDGSTAFEVPAGVPIYFMALDAEGRAVQRMRSFTHLMPGEVQGCIGCHSSRNDAAQTHLLPVGAERKFQKLQEPEWGVRGFDYAGIVQPVLDKHCVECHSGPTPEGRVDLSGDQTDYFNVSYEVLARGRKERGEAQWESPFVNWIPTYNGFEKNILEVTPKAWGTHQSKLTELILTGHPAEDGKKRVHLPEWERNRIFAWIDLNVPYYGTIETTDPDARGSRRIYPASLDKTLGEVAQRRCASCHESGKVPREFWTRIANAQLNSFLLAPLAKDAGGSERCGKAIFLSQEDPDYQKILRTFDPIQMRLREKPRIDMPGSSPTLTVNRSCK